MNEPAKNPFDAMLDAFRQIVREEIADALANGHAPVEKNSSTLLTPEQAAALLGGDVKKQVHWLYRHSKQLPFARKLSRKQMRFDEGGLRRWLATRK